MTALYERYRPANMEEVVGQPATVRRLLFLRQREGWLGQVFLFAGPSGTGKTTMGRIIAADVADEFSTWEIDAQDLTVEMLREWERGCSFRTLGGRGYAFIVNEFHNARGPIVSRLQTVLEDRHVQKNSTWVFTTTEIGQRRLFDSKVDAAAMLSRCMCFELADEAENLVQYAKYVQAVARQEELDGKPLEAYITLLDECNLNVRQALQHVASGGMME